MSRDSKRKFAIVAGISECLVYAEAKYCAFEIHGEPKYYVCPRTEYCCNFGCCVSPGFQIYHLWYYWLLVIIMFLVCSGGGWWYRYWLQGRYRAAASAVPSRGGNNSRSQNTLPGRPCVAQQASITYNSARNTVLLHRMWKGGCRRPSIPASAYAGQPVGPPVAASSAHFQNTGVVLNDVNCPYYQLYGPPPSYETVIAQTRGKLSSPMSPERSSRSNADSASSATGSSQHQDVPSRCYNHSSPYNGNHPSQTASRIVDVDNPTSCYEQNTDLIHQVDPLDSTSSYSRYAPPYVADDGTTPVHTAGRQGACLPLHYHGGPIPPLDYEEDPTSIVPDTYRIYHDTENLERLPSYRGSTSDARAGRAGISSDRQDSSTIEIGETSEAAPSAENVEDRQARRSQESRDDFHCYTRNHSGSLKFVRNRDDETSVHGTIPRRLAGLGTRREKKSGKTENRSSLIADENASKNLGEVASTSSSFARSTKTSGERSSVRSAARRSLEQTNPSENVILEPLTSVNVNRDEITRADEGSSRWRIRATEDNAKSTGSSDVQTSPNDYESKPNKLDRSKSLD